MIKDSYGNTRFFGVYRGVTFATDDPLSKNRIRVKVPQVLGENPTQWAWPVGVTGTAPAVGQGVWVQFEGGDPSYPIWHGSFLGSGVTSTTAVTTVPISQGGTGQTYTGVGDIIVGGFANTSTKILAVAKGSAFISSGEGQAPVWGPIDLTTTVTGVLPLGGGGSNASLSAVNGGVVYSTASAMAVTPAGVAGQVLQANGASAPTWANIPSQNYIVNGAFDIWQRFRTTDSYPALTGTAGFSADRWRGNGNSGHTWSKQTAGLTGFQYCMRVARDSGSSAATKVELIRDLETTPSVNLQGKNATLSFYARSGAGFSAASPSSLLDVNTVIGYGTDDNLTTAYRPEALSLGTGDTNYRAGVAVNPITNKTYLANYGSPLGTVSILDGDTGVITGTITGVGTARDVAVNQTTNKIYVVSGTTIYAIDGVTLAATSFTLATSASRIKIDYINNIIYAASLSSLKVVDGTTGITLATFSNANSIADIAVNSITRTAYILESISYNVQVVTFSAGTYSLSSTIALPFNNNVLYSIEVNPVTNKVYVGGGGTPQYLYVIDGVARTVDASISMSSAGSPYVIGVNSNTNFIYAATSYTAGFAVINGATNTIIKIVAGAVAPIWGGMAVNSASGAIYVVDSSTAARGLYTFNRTIKQRVSISSSWTRYSFPVYMPATATQLGVSVNYTPTAGSTAIANEYFEVTGVQLEEGTVATPFRRSTTSIQEELAQCQRMYYAMTFPTVGDLVTMGGYYSLNNWAGTIIFPVTMRVAPVGAGSAATSFRVRSSGTTVAGTGVLAFNSPATPTINSSIVSFVTAASTSISQDPGHMYSNVANTFIEFTAEL